MKKSVIILICCLFLFSCASVDKKVDENKSEVPNPAGKYIEKVKKDPLGEALDWWIVLDVLESVSFD